MATRIDVVIQNAIRTFSKFARRGSEFNPREVNELKSLTNDLTVSDINLFGNFLTSKGFKEYMGAKMIPLDCIPVYEDSLISVGVFVLKEGAKLPIHDHPNMYGILKVLEGVIKVTSYSFLDYDKTAVINDRHLYYNYPLKVVKFPEILLEKQSECCLLTPTEKNIHEVECVKGPAAFLDILSPPYEDGDANEPRACHYFKEVEANDEFFKLVQIKRSF